MNFNATTQNVYSEFNQEHLEEHKAEYGLSSNEWAGFHQWKSVGRKVKKGAKACKIMAVWDKEEKNKSGEIEKKKGVKGLCVFNLEHTEEI